MGLPETCAAGKQLPCMGGELEAGKGRRAAWTAFTPPIPCGAAVTFSLSAHLVFPDSRAALPDDGVGDWSPPDSPQLCCCRRCPAPHTGETHKQRWGALGRGCRLTGTAQGLIGYGGEGREGEGSHMSKEMLEASSWGG